MVETASCPTAAEIPDQEQGASMNRRRVRMRPGRAELAAFSILLSLLLLFAAGTRATAQTFLRGDTNADGIVGISDGVSTVLYLFGGGRPPPCLDAADSDDSGQST